MAKHWLEPYDGAWLAPSFADRHCHPLFAAREAASLNLSDCKSIDAILEKLSSYLKANPQTKWIDATPFERGIARDFLSSTLDVVSASVPITLHSSDHHALWVNSAALRAANLLNEDGQAATMPDLSDGQIVCDTTGRPSGLLLEWSAMKLALDQQPKPTLDEDLKHLSAAQSQLASAGVSSVTDAWIDPGMGEVYLEAAVRGLLVMPVELWVRTSPDELDSQMRYLERLLQRHAAMGSPDLVIIRGIKVFLDGVLSSKTAALLDTYLDGSSGDLIWTDKELFSLLARLSAVSTRLRPHFHAIGDRAVNQALNVIEAMEASNSWSGGELAVIAHAELVSTSDALRFGSLSVEVAISPQWLETKSADSSLATILPEHLIAKVGNFTPLVRARATITFGSDWPVSEPTPIIAVAKATAHLISSGYPPEEALALSWGFASANSLQTGAGPNSRRLCLSINPLDVVKHDPHALVGLQIL